MSTTMLRLTERRRVILAEKFGDLANLALVALVVAQALSDRRLSIRAGILGIALWVLLMGGTYLLAGEDR